MNEGGESENDDSGCKIIDATPVKHLESPQNDIFSGSIEKIMNGRNGEWTIEDLKLKEMYCKINFNTLQVILDPVFNCLFSPLNTFFKDHTPCQKRQKTFVRAE